MVHNKLDLSTANELKILAFGNSLTEGYTDFGMKFHPYGIELRNKLVELLPDFTIAVDINGVSGDRVLPSLGGRTLQRIQSACPLRTNLPPKYDLVILLSGTNDLAYMINNPTGPEEIFAGLKKCYDHVLESRASLLCLTVPERSIDRQTSALASRAKEARLKLNEMIAKFVEESQGKGQNEEPAEDAAGMKNKVFMMDLAAIAPFSSGEDKEPKSPLWHVDGLHMTAEGYDFVGQELGSFIHGLL